MSKNNWHSKLIDELDGLRRYEAERLDYQQFKSREIQSEINRIRERISHLEKKLENCHDQLREIRGQGQVKEGYYWARNKYRDPDEFDMIIRVKKGEFGIQTWSLLNESELGWDERLEYEYELGEFLAEAKKPW